MGFVLDGLESESYDRKYPDRVLLDRILSYFRPHTLRMGVVSAALALTSIAGVAAPGADLPPDRPDRQAPGPRGVRRRGGGHRRAGGPGLGFRLRQRAAGHDRGRGRGAAGCGKTPSERTIAHDLSFFDEHPSGKIVSRIASDTQDFSATVTLVSDLASQVLQVGLLAVWLVSISPRLTLLLFAMAPVAVAIALSFRAIARPRQPERQADHRRHQRPHPGVGVRDHGGQDLPPGRGAVLQLPGRKPPGLPGGPAARAVDRHDLPGHGHRGRGGRRGAGLGRRQGLRKPAALSPGDWFLFMQAAVYFWWPLMSIASFWSQFQDGLSAAERVFALIDREPRVRQTGENLPVSGGARLRRGVPGRAFRLQREGDGAGRLLAGDPPRGVAGRGRAHGGRQELAGPPGHALLRVPGRHAS